MRSTLWSRAARPKLNGSYPLSSTSSPCRSSVIRKTTSAPIRRQLTVNDVFTLLLTPILATALLADTSWKDKRRKDWAHKIAEVEAETDQIQSQTAHSWQALQHRPLGLGAAQQRRHYSDPAFRLDPGEDEDLPLHQPEFGHKQLALEDLESEPTWFEVASKKATDSGDGPRESPEHIQPSFTPHALERSERLRRMLAIKLALTLTIYLNTGVSPSKVRKEIRIPDIAPDLTYNPHESSDLSRLLQRMRDLCSRIQNIQQALPDGASPVRNENLSADSQKLQDDISLLSERYQTSSIDMPELVTSYTLAVLHSPVPPTSKAYLALFRGFARGSNGHGSTHDLAMQTLFAWEQSQLPFDDRDLFVILTELARLKHVQKFDGLMRDLTMSPSPINAIGKWTWVQAKDIQVPVPKSYHPALLLTLVHCALRFDQPQKAEAWSEILRRTWINVNDPNQKTPLQLLFTNWMRYCEVQGNWRQGVAWLDAAQKWAVTVASFDIYSLQRLAVGMLALCFACGKSEEYEEILNAAIDSGIPGMDPGHFLERTPRRAICREWQHLHYEVYRHTRDTRADDEKVQAFQSKVRDVAQRLLPEKDGADIEWRQAQENKPDPLVAGTASTGSDQPSTQAMALWQQIYTKNQEALNATRAQCALQGKQIRSLVSKLECQERLVRRVGYQKNQMRELEGSRVEMLQVNQVGIEMRQADNVGEYLPIQLPTATQIEPAHQTSVVAEPSIAPRPQRLVAGNGEIALASKTEPRVSALVSPPRSNYPQPGPYKHIDRNLYADDFLLSRLVKA